MRREGNLWTASVVVAGSVWASVTCEGGPFEALLRILRTNQGLFGVHVPRGATARFDEEDGHCGVCGMAEEDE